MVSPLAYAADEDYLLSIPAALNVSTPGWNEGGNITASSAWNFSRTELNAEGGTSKPVGIMMSDYTGKPAGTYEDSVTYTVSADSDVPQYADKLAVTTHNGREWGCFTMGEGGFEFNAQTITSEQAAALAQYQAGITGNNCAVIYRYDYSEGNMYAAKNDGNTVSGTPNDSADGLGLTGYTVYYAAK